jgi:predicted RNase H-like nuclease
MTNDPATPARRRPTGEDLQVEGSAAGIDGYGRGAWVAVVLSNGSFSEAIVGSSLDRLLPRLKGLTVGIDIPIGLPDEGEREADRLARQGVGQRRSSIFMTPPRRLLAAESHAAANLLARQASVPGVSLQAFALKARIAEAEAAIRAGWTLYEVHPEVSFAHMNGEPVAWSKFSYRGAIDRRQLLERVGIRLPNDLNEASGVPTDDVLDAAAAAWSADRIAANQHISLPDPPERFSDGLPAAIHV